MMTLLRSRDAGYPQPVLIFARSQYVSRIVTETCEEIVNPAAQSRMQGGLPVFTHARHVRVRAALFNRDTKE